MIAAAVIAIVFAGIFVVTWLAARAEAAQARCDEHLRRIQHQLEVSPPAGAGHPPPRRRTPH